MLSLAWLKVWERWRYFIIPIDREQEFTSRLPVYEYSYPPETTIPEHDWHIMNLQDDAMTGLTGPCLVLHWEGDRLVAEAAEI